MERSPQESPAGYLEEMRREADHLQRVLEDFLAFARPGSARVEEIALSVVAERAAADPALGDARVTVSTAAAPVLRADPQLLERAVRNLLRNAVEAQRGAGAGDRAADHGAVEVSVAPLADGGCELVVADRGSGVPEEIEERLFHPFVTGRAGGVGLGLALAHRIVSLHGGGLRLEPRPGGGTRAVMSFPADRIVTEGNKPPGGAPPPDDPSGPA
jgi:signal transduction histidine kinase